jgi:hypothetical protein
MSYVASWAILPRAAVDGWIGWPTVNTLNGTVYAPIAVYVAKDLPGANLLNRLRWVATNGFEGLEGVE